MVKKKGAAALRSPTPKHEQRFWQLIEEAWAGLGAEVNRARTALAQRDPDDAEDDDGRDDDDDDDDEGDQAVVEGALEGFLENLERVSAGLSSEELTDLDRVLERKLYDLDRAEIHEVTDGSDDGFLYCRGFIVALGKEFYKAVNDDPAVALADAECEDMCYFFAHLHEKRFGSMPDTGSGISRESSSNAAGW
jgi:uncharacterized protein DUF4240